MKNSINTWSVKFNQQKVKLGKNTNPIKNY